MNRPLAAFAGRTTPVLSPRGCHLCRVRLTPWDDEPSGFQREEQRVRHTLRFWNCNLRRQGPAIDRLPLFAPRLQEPVLVATQKGVPDVRRREQSQQRQRPPCQQCAGTGRVVCSRCDGYQRVNYIGVAMLPEGVWPQWCPRCFARYPAAACPAPETAFSRTGCQSSENALAIAGGRNGARRVKGRGSTGTL